MLDNKTIPAVATALLAAVLYGVSSPFSKLLLVRIPPALMAALLYLGAGFGMLAVKLVKVWSKKEQIEAKLTKKEIPFIAGMIFLDIAAPIFLMFGLKITTAANVSLLNNFEIVATSLIALLIFKEAVGKRMWFAITLITLASIILSVEDFGSLTFSKGSFLVLAACVCWGFENNCTRKLSIKDPLQIVVIKGFGSGIGSLSIAVAVNEFSYSIPYILLALLLGFIAYGLSIYFYIMAQRQLGAARTSAFYAAAPFIGVLFSWIVFGSKILLSFLLALLIMLTGTYFAVFEKHKHIHVHEQEVHEHKHSHNDGHHNHTHDIEITGEHSHLHTHENIEHRHAHTPDIHHRHKHEHLKEND